MQWLELGGEVSVGARTIWSRGGISERACRARLSGHTSYRAGTGVPDAVKRVMEGVLPVITARGDDRIALLRFM